MTVGLLVCLAFIVGAAGWPWRQPEITPAMRGELAARRLGCLGCHGPGGQGGVRNPGSTAGSVPGWEGRELQLYATSDASIAEWIIYGEPRTAPASEEPGPSGFIPMPAYADKVSPGELDDLIAYVRAVSGRSGSASPQEVYEGGVVAERFGCFGCHGSSGMGGIGNPGSLTGRIPAWDGEEFSDLVRDERELRAWILDGRIDRLWNDTLARGFLERQIIQMPAYRDVLSDAELDALVAYVGWLRHR